MDKKIKDRGIIFNGEMVRAILDGRKTQTRRILSPRQLKMIDTASSIGECYPLDCGFQHENSQSYYREWCPFGQVGDRLYVRETFRVHSRATDVATLAYKASERQSWTQQVASMPFVGNQHNALDDAIHQAKYVSAIWQKLVPTTSD